MRNMEVGSSTVFACMYSIEPYSIEYVCDKSTN